MKLITHVFGSNPGWQRLLAAFRASVRENCQRAEIEVLDDPPAGKPDKRLPYNCFANRHKLRRWRDAVYENDCPLVLIDADVVVLRNLGEVFRVFRFDVAYTARPGQLRVNGGVVFVRPNARSRAFMDRWVEIDDALYEHQPAALAETCQYGGLNQAALVRLLKDPPECDLLALPCEAWNSVQETWHTVCESTAAVHIKSGLRQLALGALPATDENLRVPIEARMCGVPETETIRPALEAWRRYDPGEKF